MYIFSYQFFMCFHTFASSNRKCSPVCPPIFIKHCHHDYIERLVDTISIPMKVILYDNHTQTRWVKSPLTFLNTTKPGGDLIPLITPQHMGNHFHSFSGPLNSLRPRQMDAISQTTFSNAFSWMTLFEFRLKFHWSLFPGVQLTIFQHWFR